MAVSKLRKRLRKRQIKTERLRRFKVTDAIKEAHTLNRIPRYPLGPTQQAWEFCLVGAGGIGARLGPLIAKLIRPTDSVVVVDHDTVEERNLTRQHFARGDVGQPKALLVAERIKAALPIHCRDVTVTAYQTRFSLQWASENLNKRAPALMIGAVDNVPTRLDMYNWATANSLCYIDAGNRMRSGQVIGVVRNGAVRYDAFKRVIHDWTEIARQEKTQPAVDPASCGLRLDEQTIMANCMAADVAAGMLAMVTHGHPLSTLYIEFGTVPPRVTPEQLSTTDGFQPLKVSVELIQSMTTREPNDVEIAMVNCEATNENGLHAYCGICDHCRQPRFNCGHARGVDR